MTKNINQKNYVPQENLAMLNQILNIKANIWLNQILNIYFF